MRPSRFAPFLALLVTPFLATAQDGFLDATFYADGRVELPAAQMSYGDVIATAPDQRIVIAGTQVTTGAPHKVVWAILDGSAAAQVCSLSAPLGSVGFEVTAALFDSTGRLVIVGEGGFEGEGLEGVVLRFLYPSCTLDPTFGNGGGFRTAFFEGSVHFRDSAFDPTGRLVVAGYHESSPDTGLVLRLLANGTPDTSFHFDGYAQLVRSHDLQLEAVAVRPDGRVVAVGDHLYPGGREILVAGWTTAGTKDTSLAPSGWVEIGIAPAHGVALELDPGDGAMLIAATVSAPGPGWSTLVRMQPDGDLDPTFGTDGIAQRQTWAHSESLTGLARLSDGRLVVLGRGSDTVVVSDGACFLYRFTESGGPDDFGLFGISAFNWAALGSNGVTCWAIALQAGRPVVVGRAAFGTIPSAVAARLENALIFADGFESGSTDGW